MRDAAKLPWHIAWPTNIAIGLLVFAMVAMIVGGIVLTIGVFKLFD